MIKVIVCVVLTTPLFRIKGLQISGCCKTSVDNFLICHQEFSRRSLPRFKLIGNNLGVMSSIAEEPRKPSLKRKTPEGSLASLDSPSRRRKVERGPESEEDNEDNTPATAASIRHESNSSKGASDQGRSNPGDNSREQQQLDGEDEQKTCLDSWEHGIESSQTAPKEPAGPTSAHSKSVISVKQPDMEDKPETCFDKWESNFEDS